MGSEERDQLGEQIAAASRYFRVPWERKSLVNVMTKRPDR